MLSKFGVPVLVEETERVDSMRYSWARLLALAHEVQNHLIQVQPIFHRNLEQSVVLFQTELGEFTEAYDEVSCVVIPNQVHLC